jgi:hypothetical protein
MTLLIIILILCAINLLLLIPISVVIVRLMEILTDMATVMFLIPPKTKVAGRRFGPDEGLMDVPNTEFPPENESEIMATINAERAAQQQQLMRNKDIGLE